MEWNWKYGSYQQDAMVGHGKIAGELEERVKMMEVEEEQTSS